MNTKVGIQTCETYDEEILYSALSRAVELAGDLDVRGKTVLLKPNILYDTPPEKACTTHPVFLQASIRLLKEKGAAKILVGDSPGLQPPNFKGKASGLGPACERAGAVWVDFAREKMELPCPGGKVSRQFTVSAVLREADYVISLPKLKTHQLMFFTGAMKNLFGLIPSLLKSPYHVRHPNRSGFASMIVDLNAAVMADYAFMDAVVGMEGPGPGSGTPRDVGLVLASSNLLAMDMAACRIIGYPVLDIPINKEALSRKIWLESPEDIEYPGLNPEDVLIPDYEKISLAKEKNQLLEFLLPQGFRKFKEARAPRPVILSGSCIRCGNCIRICSSRAMSFQEEEGKQKVVIDYKKCIRCYCCHEICPAMAIEVKK